MSSSSRRTTIPNVAAFIILEVVALCLVGTREGVQKSWLGQIFTGVKVVVWTPFDKAGTYLNLRKVNRRLAEDNFALYCALDSLRHRTDTSAGATSGVGTGAGTPARHNFAFLPADIVTMSHGSQHNYIIIDKGSNDGVEAGDGLITAQGVVGIVESITDHFSSAISYANAAMVTSARAGHDGSVGSLTWTGRGSRTSLLSGIPLHSPAQEGDTVFTSGFSSIFPADIPLGTIVDRQTGSGSFCEFTVALFEDFSSLRHVMVVKNKDKAEIEELKQEAECKKETAKE